MLALRCAVYRLQEGVKVQGKWGLQVTGFSNTEEEAVGKVDAVPWSLEDELKKVRPPQPRPATSPCLTNLGARA